MLFFIVHIIDLIDDREKSKMKKQDLEIEISGTVAGRKFTGPKIFERLAERLRPGGREEAQKALTEIAQDFTRTEAELFSNQGRVGSRSGWKGLKASTKRRKGNSMILIDKGRLKRSLTDVNSPDHYSLVTISRRGLGLHIGTNVPYSRFVNAKRKLIEPTRENVKRWSQMLARIFTKN